MKVSRFIIRLAGLAAFFALMAGLVYVYGGTMDVPLVSANTPPVVGFSTTTMSVREGDCDTSGVDVCRAGHSVNNFPGAGNGIITDTDTGRPLKRFYYPLTITVLLSPAIESDVHLIWYIPHPDCRTSVGVSCPFTHPEYGDTVAEYNIDYVASGLDARKITIPSGSARETFKFLIIADNDDEENETVKIYLLSTDPNVSVSPDTLTVTIIDDDNPPSLNATESELGVFAIPTPTPTPSPTPTPVPVDIVSQYDTNGNCKIDLDEYSRAIYDLQSRKITMDEMRKIMSAMHNAGC